MFSMVVNSVQSTKKYLHLLYEIKYHTELGRLIELS